MIETNKIFSRIGIQINEIPPTLMDTFVDADGKLDYELGKGNSFELDSVIKYSKAVDECRRNNMLAILLVPKIERKNGLPQSQSGLLTAVPGISKNGGFVVFLNGDAKAKGKDLFPSNTLAHEIGHAFFGWNHPFEQFSGVTQGKDEYNLMDYQFPATQLYIRGYFFSSIINKRVLILR
jgi:hypothetical protein